MTKDAGGNSQRDTVFGIHAVNAVLTRNPDRIQQLYIQQGKANPRVKKLVEAARNKAVPIQQVDRRELDAMVQGNHQGIVAHCSQRKMADEGALETLLNELTEEPLLLILDGVTDPHNFGACVRSADAAGAHAVIVPKDNSAPLSAVAIKSSSGAAEVLPIIWVTNLARTMRWLKDRGVWISGTAMEATQSIYDADLGGARALVMGSEGKGVRRLTGEQCDQLIFIPMAGSVGSLNVSVATGICLFEAKRQRMAAK